MSVLSRTTLKSTHGRRRIVSASTLANGPVDGGISAGRAHGPSIGRSSSGPSIARSSSGPSIARSSSFILIYNGFPLAIALASLSSAFFCFSIFLNIGCFIEISVSFLIFLI